MVSMLVHGDVIWPLASAVAADQATARNAKSVADYKAGKAAALQFLVGQVTRQSKDKANPAMVGEMLRKKLGSA